MVVSKEIKKHNGLKLSKQIKNLSKVASDQTYDNYYIHKARVSWLADVTKSIEGTVKNSKVIHDFEPQGLNIFVRKWIFWNSKAGFRVEMKVDFDYDSGKIGVYSNFFFNFSGSTYLVDKTTLNLNTSINRLGEVVLQVAIATAIKAFSTYKNVSYQEALGLLNK